MNPIVLTQALTLVVIANSTPVAAKLILGGKCAWPVDCGLVLHDNQPLLGPSKTWRGLVLSILLTSIFSALIGLSLQTGALIATAAMGGDLLSSFIKRRRQLPASSMALGLDQVPESMFPLAISTTILPLSYSDVLAGTLAFVILELAASRVLFVVGLRDRPY